MFGFDVLLTLLTIRICGAVSASLYILCLLWNVFYFDYGKENYGHIHYELEIIFLIACLPILPGILMNDKHLLTPFIIATIYSFLTNSFIIIIYNVSVILILQCLVSLVNVVVISFLYFFYTRNHEIIFKKPELDHYGYRRFSLWKDCN